MATLILPEQATTTVSPAHLLAASGKARRASFTPIQRAVVETPRKEELTIRQCNDRLLVFIEKVSFEQNLK